MASEVSAQIDSLAPTPNCVEVERVKPPLRGGGVPLVTSSGWMGIPTFLHPLTYSVGAGSADGRFEEQTSPTVYDALNLGFNVLLSLLCLGVCRALLDI